jgi:hypothetical protein
MRATISPECLTTTVSLTGSESGRRTRSPGRDNVARLNRVSLREGNLLENTAVTELEYLALRAAFNFRKVESIGRWKEGHPICGGHKETIRPADKDLRGYCGTHIKYFGHHKARHQKHVNLSIGYYDFNSNPTFVVVQVPRQCLDWRLPNPVYNFFRVHPLHPQAIP